MAAPAADITEIEWQFTTPSIERARDWLDVAAVPGYVVEAAERTDITDTYYDTSDWRLRRAGLTCRLRQLPERAEITIKTSSGSKDALRRRREITEPLEGEGPFDLVSAPGRCGEILRLVCGRKPLEPLFSVVQVRQVYGLGDDEAALGEIGVDDTKIVARDTTEWPLPRLEVELSGEHVDRAQRFVDVMAVALQLTPAETSKFTAALEVTGTVPQLLESTLGPATIGPQLTAGETGYAIMRKQYAVFLKNEPGTRLGEDIEALHDMRVAARRLRAAMQTFRPYLPQRFEGYRGELGWVARALGTVRDLDVQLEQLEAWKAEGDGDSHALDGVGALLSARRKRARTRMLAVLDSRRYESFVLRFAAALRRGAPRTFQAGRASILDVAPALVEKRYRKVRKLGDAIDKQSPAEQYHALRIECKKLRYALEFVGPIYGKPATDFAARLTALQDLLGDHQDAEVAIGLLHELASQSGRRLGPETVLAMGGISERYRRGALDLRGDFPKQYRGIRGAEWKDLRKHLDGMSPKN